MEEKIIRFLELSEKFSKTENEAIGKEMEVLKSYNKIGWIKGGSSGITYGSISITQEAENETVEVLAERMVTRIKEYQEYKQLQKDLLDYFKAKQKLN